MPTRQVEELTGDPNHNDVSVLRGRRELLYRGRDLWEAVEGLPGSDLGALSRPPAGPSQERERRRLVQRGVPVNSICFRLDYVRSDWITHSSLFFGTGVSSVPVVIHSRRTRFVVTDDDLAPPVVKKGHPAVAGRRVFR